MIHQECTLPIITFKTCLQTSTGIKESNKQPEGDVPITVPMNQDDCQLKGVLPREQFAFIRLPQGANALSVKRSYKRKLKMNLKLTQIKKEKRMKPIQLRISNLFERRNSTRDRTMKHLIFGSLSLLLMSAATAPAIKAQPPVAVGPAEAGVVPSYIQQTTPVSLVSLAYRGYFKNRGIPSYGVLLSAYQSGKITAQDLVQVAVEVNRVSAEVLSDSGYLNAVEQELRDLQDD